MPFHCTYGIQIKLSNMEIRYWVLLTKEMILPAGSWSMEVVEKNIKCAHRKIIESFNAL